LSLELTYQLEDGAELLLIPPQRVNIARTYRQDPDNLAGSSRERELLMVEMHRELAQQIVRTLNRAVRQPAGVADAGPGR
jgi:outer membrane lipopolysaccharide assembly protein LptE/RlpB